MAASRKVAHVVLSVVLHGWLTPFFLLSYSHQNIKRNAMNMLNVYSYCITFSTAQGLVQYHLVYSA